MDLNLIEEMESPIIKFNNNQVNKIWPSLCKQCEKVFLKVKILIKIQKISVQKVQKKILKEKNNKMFQQSLSYLQQKPQKFNLEQVLLSLCKKSTLESQSPQIDFLDFEQKLQSINSFHQKTCQEIVEFVDTHCGQYIEINGKFETLQEKIQKVENIIKQLSIKLKDYAKVYYQDEGRIQQMMSNYQTSVVQKVLLTRCKQETQFLGKFVISFETMISKSMDNLVFSERALLIRFCKKFSSLQNLFNHHLLHQTLPEYIKIYQMLMNLVDEVEFYISQQLSKQIKYKNFEQQSLKDPKIVALHQIKLCYTYLNKLPEYYKNIEQNLIGRELQVAEKNIISNKLNLIGGKNLQVVEQFFKAIFNSIKQFPKTYPRARLLELIFSQLRKNQVKFLYTYTLPIFPISYNLYMRFICSLDETQVQLINGLRQNHNWDLKRWVDVREKNIIDRCTKDWEKDRQKIQQNTKSPDLNKWIDIIFKDNCKIDGIKNHVITLAIKVITKYSLFIESSDRFEPQYLNQLIEVQQSIQKLLEQKLAFFYDAQYNKESSLLALINKIAQSCKQTLQKSIQKLIEKNTKLLSKSCCGCLQPFKSFIMKIIKSSKQLTQHGVINIFQNIFKPLTAYLESNQNLSQESRKWIRKIVISQVMKFYDESYVTEVYQYARTNLSVEQLAQVMEVIGKERNSLFVQITEGNVQK